MPNLGPIGTILPLEGFVALVVFVAVVYVAVKIVSVVFRWIGRVFELILK